MIFYSRDDEEFKHETLGDLIDAEDLEVGETYYTAEFNPVKPSDIVGIGNIDSLIEDFSETLNDLCGESADGVFLDVSMMERADLRICLEDWVKRRIGSYKLWTISGKSTEHVITEDDV